MGANWKGKKLLNKCQQLSLRSSKSMELKVRFCPIFIFLSWRVYDWDFQLSWSLSKPDGLEHGKWLMTLGSSTQYKPNLLSGDLNTGLYSLPHLNPGLYSPSCQNLYVTLNPGLYFLSHQNLYVKVRSSKPKITFFFYL